MELSLSLGGKTSKTFNRVTAETRRVLTKTTAAAPTSPSAGSGCSLGFCMALAMNPLNETNHRYQEKLVDEYNTVEDQLTFQEKPRIKAIIDDTENTLQLNPPVQLDLLPLTPVLRHGPLLWSSDNGSSDRGSSGKDPPGKGSDVKGMVVAAAARTEKATSSLQQDFGRYFRNRNVIDKMELDARNDDTGEMERASRASDEDENGLYRKKQRLSKQQSEYLEERFNDHSTINAIQKVELATNLNLSPRQVEVWFQNRRARTKLKQTEVDCEYLKKCCETLRSENKKLHKELQELRFLKSTTSYPFCLQLPDTTLTMCPSCVRVAATTFTTITSASGSAPPPPGVNVD